ncbi:MAG: toxin [Acidobacteria bacterium]|nr:toxin [Acidobacteriota bacterium]
MAFQKTINSSKAGDSPSRVQNVSNQDDRSSSSSFTAPTISLPKGGGAIRGMGEKFAANPVTGTGSMSVPLTVSTSRSGFSPQLSLSYDSGSGNGPFGFGWSLSLPAITRKTDKGLPKYQDAIESDEFILSGAEDLVRVLVENEQGQWKREDLPPRELSGETYNIYRYRPRIEGIFARIERWTNQKHPENTFWRSISKDNITTWYGKDENSRIYDPLNPTRIFSWLISESYDDKGNAILYEYKKENSDGVVLSQAHERNRNDSTRSANRYLKSIKYGNLPSRLVQPDLSKLDWLFEVVFDFGEHNPDDPRPNDQGTWLYRHDPFSAYRAGYEVRTYRLCQRVLMFHHFPNEPEVGRDCLVRSTDFVFRNIRGNKKEDPKQGHPVASFIASATQTGYKRKSDSGYLKKSLPPLEFEYSQPVVSEEIHEIDPVSLENLPTGMDGDNYQWVDLDGEGISGFLTEQADAWFYKPNLGGGRFGPLEKVASIPSLASLQGGRQQLLDLAGDGQLDLAEFSGPTPGFYERTEDQNWVSFKPFTQLPRIDWGEPNLRFVDLDGDGHADILITEDNVFTWHASLAEEGFGPAQRVSNPFDEEKGPKLVFADGTQSIYLADMSGDGLTDLARIRNGEICYWPNLGYGRFGAKVTMDNSPWFDFPDQFDQKRIRVADIDGSGNTDIIYLHRDGVRLYFNQSGNSWKDARTIRNFPRVDNLASVTTADLLGNGTACLVWSSPLPANAGRQMRYINLMSQGKPHLLIKTVNNLGAMTEVEYAPSTKFYLQDKLAGTPWITRLPFLVHCVEKVTVSDKWRQTKFTTTYSYHHGYFDGIEREFRGFGRVEQIDVEDFGTFEKGNGDSPYITDDLTLYQPPVKTVTWFHTGTFLDRERILNQYQHEYFPNWFEALKPGEQVLGEFKENHLPEPDLHAENLTAEEWREALRACKGMTLRQEVYELDVDALQQGKQCPVKLFSTAYHNCNIQRLQPKGENKHAVFLVTESEAITYNYELDLRQEELRPDPRIAHTLNLRIDEYGNIQQSIAVAYPRVNHYEDTTLPAGTADLIVQTQKEPHLAYTETRYTNDVIEQDAHRLRVPCEVITYELIGIAREDESDRKTNDEGIDNRYFTLDELRAYKLSEKYQAGQADLFQVEEIAYHALPNRQTPQKRLVEHARTLFFNPSLTEPEPLGEFNSLGLPYENYKLALTDSLLTTVLGDKLTPEIRATLEDETRSGYLTGADLTNRFPGEENSGQYWIRSGVAGFNADAAQHFYLPEQYTDPFGNTTVLEYDGNYDLYIKSSTDPMGNRTEVTQFDFRVLAPKQIKDINENLSEVAFDVLGMPAAMAVKGKGDEGDNLASFDDALLNPTPGMLRQFFTDDYNITEAKRLLGSATARYLYYFGETDTERNQHPSCACGILREQHFAQHPDSPIQTAFEYSDGMGTVLVKKVQAEPESEGGQLRWIASGKTILNNKGKAVKQYEPYFSKPDVAHRFEELEEVGVTPVMYYDAVGRLVRTELPDGTFSRVEFSPWHVLTFDANDTVLESQWYQKCGAPAPAQPLLSTASPDTRAAWLAAQHANTPALTILDSLGREVISVAHNKYVNSLGAQGEEKYVTFTKLDAEGKPLWIRDARGNLVMRYIVGPSDLTEDLARRRKNGPYSFAEAYDIQPRDYVPCYDIAGNLLFQRSMDAADRWMLNDSAGQPLYAWDSRTNLLHTTYDALRRPVTLELRNETHSDWIVVGYTRYGEGVPDDKARNLCGKPYRVFDQSGLVTNWNFDFKGNPLETRRRLASEYANDTDWREIIPLPPETELENPQMPETLNWLMAEAFAQLVEYDALNRITRQYNWHSVADSRVSVLEPHYNERGLLQREDVVLEATKTESGYVNGERTQVIQVIQQMEHNAKGQRLSILYGNNATTTYQYDLDTFRLITLETVRQSDNKRLQALRYTYDPVGNITEIIDGAVPTVFFNNFQIDAHNLYNYDALYRLTKAEGREHAGQIVFNTYDNWNDCPFRKQYHPNDAMAWRNYTEYYDYDSVGNILSVKHTAQGDSGNSWTRQYQYATTSNRLLATGTGSATVEHYPDDPTLVYRYHYNTHGSMTDMPHLTAMEWDFTEHLHHIVRAAGSQGSEGDGCPDTTLEAWYRYDASKERTRKRIVKQGVEERLYLGDFEIFRKYNGKDKMLERETLHIMGDKQRIVLVDKRTDIPGQEPLIRYQFGDRLGSVGLELDNQAQIVSYEEYTAYGSTSYQTVRNQAETHKRYRYTGKERDEETGLNYHTARYYIPWIGRWISADPAGLIDSNDLYVYSLNRPTKLLDLKGTSALNESKKIDELRIARTDNQEKFELYLRENNLEVTKLLGKYYYAGCYYPNKKCTEGFDKAIDNWASSIQGSVYLYNKYPPEIDSHTYLTQLPDGMVYIGTPSDIAKARERIILERQLQTGGNISCSWAGALGYMIGGDEGSDVGVWLESMLSAGLAASKYVKNNRDLANMKTSGHILSKDNAQTSQVYYYYHRTSNEPSSNALKGNALRGFKNEVNQIIKKQNEGIQIIAAQVRATSIEGKNVRFIDAIGMDFTFKLKAYEFKYGSSPYKKTQLDFDLNMRLKGANVFLGGSPLQIKLDTEVIRTMPH